MSSGANGGRANGTARGEPVIGYLSLVEIENIRSIESLRWEVEPGPGWNVVLGDNGAGKSTFLRMIAYLTLKEQDRASLGIALSCWLRNGRTSGHANLKAVIPGKSIRVESEFSLQATPVEGAPIRSIVDSKTDHLDRFFVASFGPFRRFTGGDMVLEKKFESNPRVARHLSLFEEGVSFSESLAWLRLLRFKEIEEKLKNMENKAPTDETGSGAFLDALRTFMNQPGFLPNGAHLGDITSDNVEFIDGNGARISIAELSDGYRSILSLILELIRQLAFHFGPDHVFSPTSKTVIAPGVVLIDEVDAHLHPSWQSRIGMILRACFPAIQFIVTTHSPLVCQAAEVGTVFRLPRPGADEEGRMVKGVELDRLIYGDLVEAYETEAMGGIGRSDRAKEMLGRFSELNRKAIDVGLSDEERKQLSRLRGIFSESPETRP